MGGIAMGNPSVAATAVAEEEHSTHSATTGLGLMLAAGAQATAGSHGPVPSNTSRFFSVDVGLFHLVAIDQNIYWEQASEQVYRQAQLGWLEADLAAANRNRQRAPWIVVMGHIPLYCAICSQANVTTNGYLRAGGWWARHELEPLFLRYGVDFYVSGHLHMYESLFPCSANQPTQQDFEDPRAPVHVLSGNGGPGSHHVFAGKRTPMTRFQSEEFGYGILRATNGSVCVFEQRANNNDRIIDTFAVRRSGGDCGLPRTHNLATLRVKTDDDRLAPPTPAPPEGGGGDYPVLLFAYFLQSSMSVHLAYSRDGLNFTTLNGGKPVLCAPKGNWSTIRDPYIARGPDGKIFHLVASAGNFGFADRFHYWTLTLSSGRPVWSAGTTPRVMEGVPNAKCVWAPEWQYVASRKQYLAFWASTEGADANTGSKRVWARWTSDFIAWDGPPFVLLDPGFDSIDADALQLPNGTALLFFKDERGNCCHVDPGENPYYKVRRKTDGSTHCTCLPSWPSLSRARSP
eukprot:SAG22_NODE_2024_length_3122_cov_2.375455_1_plen_516_part_00